jgi:hypothetical protein
MNIASLDGGDGMAAGSPAPQWRQAWMKTLERAWQQQPQPRHGGGQEGASGAAAPAPQDAARPHAAAPSADADARLAGPAAAMAFHPAAASTAPGAAPEGEPAVTVPKAGDVAPLVAMVLPGPPAARPPLPAGAALHESRDGAAAPTQPRDPLPERHLLALPEAGGLAVWVRDASLDDAGREQLTQRLRRVLRGAGFEVHRVAVNGRAVYESAAAAVPGSNPTRS